MRLQDFDYGLPKERIAQYPLPKRDDSRLMVLNRVEKKRENQKFPDLLNYLKTGDALVFNDTKVVPALVAGKKEKTGGKVECLLVERVADGIYKVLSRPSRGMKAGNRIVFDGSKLTAEVLENQSQYQILHFNGIPDPESELRRIGNIPLPPYIQRKSEPMDRERYQTIFARAEGAVAAPTAGFHFTERLVEAIMTKGVEVIFVTLHVGPGTFLPVREEEISKHSLWEESFCLSQSAAGRLNQAREQKRRIIAVGTTICRVLESSIDEKGKFQAREGKTSLFITPGFEFRAIDGLVTNFHLPKTTLLMLVSAFAGREWVLESYQEAIRLGYRFYSYGDAMLIL